MCRPSYNIDGDRDDGRACGRGHTRSSEALQAIMYNKLEGLHALAAYVDG